MELRKILPVSRLSDLLMLVRLFVFCLITFHFTNSAYACDCSSGTLKEQFLYARILVIGKVISTREILLTDTVNRSDFDFCQYRKYGEVIGTEYKIEILESLKTDTSGIITLIVGTSSCDFHFVQGEQYLIFADYKTRASCYKPDGKFLATSSFTGTQKYNATSEYDKQKVEKLKSYRLPKLKLH